MTQYDFYPAIPATNNSPSVDQPNMQTNNQSTNDIFAEDHVTFNLPNGGTHTKVRIATPLGSDPTLNSTITAELYTKLVSSIPQWFAAVYNGSTTVVSQLTNSLAASAGSGMMPGGLQIRSGSATGVASSSVVINFNTPFPTSCVSVVVCYSGGGSLGPQTCSAGTLTASGFTLFVSGSATGVFYIATGY